MNIATFSVVPNQLLIPGQQRPVTADFGANFDFEQILASLLTSVPGQTNLAFSLPAANASGDGEAGPTEPLTVASPYPSGQEDTAGPEAAPELTVKASPMPSQEAWTHTLSAILSVLQAAVGQGVTACQPTEPGDEPVATENSLPPAEKAKINERDGDEALTGAPTIFSPIIHRPDTGKLVATSPDADQTAGVIESRAPSIPATSPEATRFTAPPDQAVGTSPDQLTGRPMSPLQRNTTLPAEEVTAPAVAQTYAAPPRESVTRPEVVAQKATAFAPLAGDRPKDDTPIPVAVNSAHTIVEPPVRIEVRPVAPQVVPPMSIGDAVRLVRWEGESEARLQLHPESLGQVLVQLHVANGDVAVRMLAETPQAQSLIQNHLPQLKAAFIAQGLQVGGLTVAVGSDTSAFDAPSRQPGRWAGTPEHRRSVTSPDDVNESTNSRLAATWRSNLYTVDYQV